MLHHCSLHTHDKRRLPSPCIFVTCCHAVFMQLGGVCMQRTASARSAAGHVQTAGYTCVSFRAGGGCLRALLPGPAPLVAQDRRAVWCRALRPHPPAPRADSGQQALRCSTHSGIQSIDSQASCRARYNHCKHFSERKNTRTSPDAHKQLAQAQLHTRGHAHERKWRAHVAVVVIGGGVYLRVYMRGSAE